MAGRPSVRVIGTILLMLAVPAALAAQTVSATTGAMNGKAIDKTNAVLPGVTVTITSPSMMGSRTAVTGDDGTYRFPAIPPGDYTVTFELAGFATVVREGIRVALGFTATVNAELGVASLQENVTVTGTSPVVDTQSTAISTNFDARTLASLPSARDMWAILAESPAVSLTRIDVGGSAAGTQTGYSVYGTSGQNRPMVEGIVATEGTGAAGFYYDYGSMDEVTVETAAHSAEMPWPGVQSQFIAKSGGNAYHGTFYGDYENQNWQAFNVNADQIRRGAEGGANLSPTDVNRLANYRDINTDLGGYIRKDRLWWFGSFRNQDVSAWYVNFPVKPHRTTLHNYTGKGTYQLTQNNKLVGYATANRKHQPTRLDSFLLGNTTGINTAEDTTWEQLYWAWVWKGEWNSIISDKLYFELRTGQFGYNWPNLPNGNKPRYEDIGNNLIRGGNRDWQRDRRRNQVLGSMSYFKDGLAGSHNFKFGGEVFRETTTEYWKDGYPGDVVHVLRNSLPQPGPPSGGLTWSPIEVYLIDAPSVSENGLWTHSGFISDVWRVNSRLTLNPGLRFDRYRAFLPEQVHGASRWSSTVTPFAAVDDVITFNLVSPRIGGTYDFAGNGKTVVKFNYGEYWYNPGADFLLNGVNPNSARWERRYAWTDPNNNGVYDPGEEGRLIATRGGPTDKLDPNLKDTYSNEFAAWFERELFANFGIRTGFVLRGIRNQYARVNVNQPFEGFNVPVSVLDPGPDGDVNTTADNGPDIRGFNLNPAYVGRTPDNLTRNVPNTDDDFATWEITANRRFTGRWSLLASFSNTWVKENANAYFGNSVRTNGLVQTPNDTINTVDGRHEFTTWTAKIHGTYQAPWDVKVTPIVRMQSGQPYGRTFSTNFNYANNVRILAEPIGTRRQDNIMLYDARAEKVFRVARSLRVSGFLDVFNLFNTNAEQNITWSSGRTSTLATTFGRPVQIIPPRIVRIGARVTF